MARQNRQQIWLVEMFDIQSGRWKAIVAGAYSRDRARWHMKAIMAKGLHYPHARARVRAYISRDSNG